MKKILITIGMTLMLDLYAVCNAPISRNNINPGKIPTSERYNLDFNNLFARANDLPGDCFADLSLQTKHLADGSVTTAKLANSSIMNSKFANGVLPIFRRPLKIRAYTSAGNYTWIKTTDVGSIFVQVVGGGGTNGDGTTANPTASSFGPHCTANGGGNTASFTRGVGGSASGGDINLSGGNGDMGQEHPYCVIYSSTDDIARSCWWMGKGGKSMLGAYGRGSYTRGRSGAGAGGFCAKVIDVSAIVSVSLTVGSAGTSATTLPANSGIVLIYEFGK